MIGSQQARRESAARWIGSFLGLFIGAVAVLYLDRLKSDASQIRTAPAITRVAQPLPTPPPPVEVSAPLVVERSHISDAKRLLESLRRTPIQGAPKSAEAERLEKMTREELDGEVQSATSEAAAYEAEGRYAPEHHARLYHRVNVLFDVRGLTKRQNAWLAQAVQALNEIAVRHTEDALREGDIQGALQTADGFGEWSYRLNNDQERRLTTTLDKVELSSRLHDH
jgi:hypothetical protein